ncbi:hypothetical protein D3C76_1330690 [compost metagenome]
MDVFRVIDEVVRIAGAGGQAQGKLLVRRQRGETRVVLDEVGDAALGAQGELGLTRVVVDVIGTVLRTLAEPTQGQTELSAVARLVVLVARQDDALVADATVEDVKAQSGIGGDRLQRRDVGQAGVEIAITALGYGVGPEESAAVG